jgi:glycosyltransferase involved in cell wall biosynthesis
VAETVAEIAPFSARRDIAFLGGFSHKPNVEAVEWFAREAMPLLRRRIPGVKLRIYGSNMPDDLAAKLKVEDDVVVEGWIADVREAYDACRVFVAPLQSGAGIKGKVVSALAHGVPTVMSPLAAEGIGVAHGNDGFIAASPHEWIAAITKVYGSQESWQRVSKAAHASAQRQFGFASGVAQMQKALQRIDVYTTANDCGLVTRAGP